MGICPICNRPMHGEEHDPYKDWNWHHYWWPRKAKWVQQLCREKRQDTRQVHIKCHDSYNFMYTHICVHGDTNCSACAYRRICCYNKHTYGG